VTQAAHPWLQPLWRRILVVAFCVAWVAMEAWLEPWGTWFWMFVAITAWGVWEFFLSGKYRQAEPG
jgi:hypothetical protein